MDIEIIEKSILGHNAITNPGGNWNSLIKMSENIYILAYVHAGTGTGFIKVFEIDERYLISEKSVFQYNYYGTLDCSVIKIDDTHFALAFIDRSNGFIRTYEIEEDYSVVEKSSLAQEPSRGRSNAFVRMSETHFILAYTGVSYGGNYVKVLELKDDFSFNAGDALSVSFMGKDNSMIKIDDTHFALSHMGSSLEAVILVLELKKEDLSVEIISTLAHDNNKGAFSSLIKIDDEHIAVAYGAWFQKWVPAYIKTFKIEKDYSVTEKNCLAHDKFFGKYNSLMKIDNTHLILATGSEYFSKIKVFSLDENYVLTKEKTLESDNVNGSFNGEFYSLARINDTHFALAFKTKGNDGYIKVFNIKGDFNFLYTFEAETTPFLDSILVLLPQIENSEFEVSYKEILGEDYTTIKGVTGTDFLIESLKMNQRYDIKIEVFSEKKGAVEWV